MAPGNVSIHAPARGATELLCHCALHSAFQFTRPQEARRPTDRHESRSERFNSRARKRRDVPQVVQICKLIGFNSRARKRRDKRTYLSFSSFLRFNSRARKRRDMADIAAQMHDGVSIHAPARGATRCPRLTVMWSSSFNSRARKRRDLRPCERSNLDRCFNSRARKRRDHVETILGGFMIGFNSRARKRRDNHWWTWQEHLALFQFTRPQEARQPVVSLRPVLPVSIHAPARGATGSGLSEAAIRESFNSRARKRRDLILDILSLFS